MKILHAEPKRFGEVIRLELEASDEVDVTYIDADDQASFDTAIQSNQYDAVFVRLGLALTENSLKWATKLKYIVTPTTGLDHIDVAAAENREIRVVSLKGETRFLEKIPSTAEHTWALLLGLTRGLHLAHADVSAGNWRREPFLAKELAGRRLGIVGLGRIGRMVARYAQAFGMDVTAFDRDGTVFDQCPGVQQSSLGDLLANSDVVSLHLPLSDETRGFLSRARVAEMKAGAFLINTARGELMDEAAVVAALNAGSLAGVAVDVLTGDSSWTNQTGMSPLLDAAREGKNILVTPHIGGYGQRSIEMTRQFIVQKFLRIAGIASEGERKS